MTTLNEMGDIRIQPRPPIYRLTLPFPPSTNTYWRHVGTRVLISEKGRAFKARVKGHVLLARRDQARRPGKPPIVPPAPLGGRVAIVCELHPATRGRRDLDNFDGKALWDSLTGAGLWKDDSQVDLRLTIRRPVSKNDGYCTIHIWEL